MKKLTVILNFIFFFFYSSKAQNPQFAVVRPDGSTYICPTWDSAYNKALNGDAIYLPGGVIYNQIALNKRLYIYGAGHHPDSSAVTGKTIFTSNLFIYKNASGGSIEGVQVSSVTIFMSDNKINNYLIKRCYLNGLTFSNVPSPVIDSLPENVFVVESVLNYATDGSGIPSIKGYNATSNYFTKNIITGQVTNLRNSIFENNDFLRENFAFSVTCSNITNSTFKNNIFLDPDALAQNSGNCGNTYLNNLKYSYPDFFASSNCPVVLQQANLSVPNISDIFIAYANNGFTYSNNYQLKPTCTGKNAGTDGTDVGIYGTTNPTPNGWIPGNPHIYFRQIAPQTNNNGQLQIQFKVRTGN